MDAWTPRPGAAALRRLVDGFGRFRETYFETNHELFDELVREGQHPRALVIGCSDSRSDPALLTAAEPGDLFVVRNVAALVPPHDADGRPHGTAAAIEFAVRGLGVDQIVVLGHSLCGGARAIAALDREPRPRFEYLDDWVGIGRAARDAVDALPTEAPGAFRQRLLEQALIGLSVRNLMTYPWIAAGVGVGALAVHGWYFDLARGELFAMQGDQGRFAPLEAGLTPAPLHGPCGTAGCGHDHGPVPEDGA